jgi:Tfp pilus assembly protein PilP
LTMRFHPSLKAAAALIVALGCAGGVSARGVQAKSAPPKKAEQTKAAPQTKAPAKKPAATTSAPKPPAQQAAAEAPAGRGRRDPFEALVHRPGRGATAIPDRLPPGKAGLVVGTMNLDGVVRAPSGMIAVVSNPQRRVYFLREGDRLYDGRVERITMDGMTLRESGQDAFGKPLERVVSKRLYPSAGESR